MNGIFNIIVITIIGNITMFGYTYFYGASPQAIPGIASILLIDIVVSAVILNDLKEV